MALPELRRDYELREILPDRLVAGVSEGLLGRLVEFDDHTDVVHPDHAVVRRAQHRGLERLALAQRALDPPAGHEHRQLIREPDEQLQQLLVRRRGRGRVELGDGEDALRRPHRHRNRQGRLEADLDEQVVARQSTLALELIDPDDVAALPGAAWKARAAAHPQPAALGPERLEIDGPGVPALDEVEHPVVLGNLPQRPGVPAQERSDRRQVGRRRLPDRVRREQLPGQPVLRG